jgi:hypothetical protein
LKTWGREGAIKKKKKKIHKDFVNKFDQLVFLGGLDLFPFYSSWGESWPFVSKNLTYLILPKHRIWTN